MLILTRRPGEALVCRTPDTFDETGKRVPGTEIWITILGTRGPNQVRIGVTAPRATKIDREEIAERIAREQGRKLERAEVDDVLEQ